MVFHDILEVGVGGIPWKGVGSGLLLFPHDSLMVANTPLMAACSGLLQVLLHDDLKVGVSIP